MREDPALGIVVEHGGTTRGFESWLSMLRERDLVFVVLCNGRGMREAMLRELIEAACSDDARPPAALSAGELGAFAGEYAPAGGGRIAVEVAGAGLVLVPDVEAVLALEFGPSAELAQEKRLAERARKLVDRLAAGDADGAQELMARTWGPGWIRTMITLWREWLDERGELRELEVLGSKADRTALRLVHERAKVVWVLRWEKDVLNGWSLQGGIPAGVFLPAAGGPGFELRDPEGSRWKLAFEEDGGRERTLVLSGMQGLRATRVK